MHLVVVESPAKAKTIEKYLGKGYKVMASKGHVVDLPKSNLGIDVEKDFRPDYVVTNTKSLSALKKAFKEAESLILAVDSDREGEAIGWHIARELGLIDIKGKRKPKSKPLQRITFTEITKSAIQDALKSLHEINLDMVDAQQARRVLDRLVGYKLSPLLWQKIRYGLSAGRVQSVALRLIVDREEERTNFVPEEYWNVLAYLSESAKDQENKLKLVNYNPEAKANNEQKDKSSFSKFLPFKLTKLDGKIISLTKESIVKETITPLLKEKWIIKDISTQNSLRKPKPPFITSTLQQTSANRFGYSAKQTMKLAQDLYEAGLITYMRTDSLNMSTQAIGSIRTYVDKKYGSEFLSEKTRLFKNKSKSSQEAHEAIRPTDVKKTADTLSFSDKHKKVYELIWQRSVATQMSDAKIETVKITIDVGNCQFQLTGQKLIFKGFLLAYPEKFTEVEIPDLKIDQELFLNTLLAEQKYTDPPARYTEASLIKALESYGIGRPSTYAPIISTITTRNYIEKDGKSLVPTDTGMVVIKLLKKHFPEIVDTGFTADIEDKLDLIAQGKQEWVSTIRAFYQPFEKNLETKREQIKKEDYTVLGESEEICPECGKKMVVKLGRFGKFYSCVDFPKCKGMKSFEEDKSKEIDIKSEEFLEKYKLAPLTEDGRDYLLKKGRYGYFWAHPDYPKVKDAKPLELSQKMFTKVYGKTPKAKDGKKMVLRRGRFGEFWAHPDYPEVKEVVRINAKELKEKKASFELL